MFVEGSGVTLSYLAFHRVEDQEYYNHFSYYFKYNYDPLAHEKSKYFQE